MEHMSAAEYATWGDAWRAWRCGETKDVSPFHASEIKPQEWRLTDQGVLAQKDIADGVLGITYDFVLKRDFFGPGYWHRVAYSRPLTEDDKQTITNHQNAGHDIASLSRPSVHGYGSLVEYRKIEKPAAPQSVNLANWTAGADAFAATFRNTLGPMFDAMSKAQQANGLPPAPTQPGTPEQGEGNNGAIKGRNKTGQVKRGRKKLSTEEEKRRNGILSDWERARNAGTAMKTFCSERSPSLTVKELERIVAWKATRDRRKSQS